MAKKTASEKAEESATEEVLELNELKENRTRLNKNELISTGSTLLDIKLSSTIYGGILTGKYYHFVGGSTSGKTMTLLHVIANIVNLDRYNDYDIFVDEPEDGNEIDMESMFGAVTASRIIAPNYDKEDGTEVYSVTVDQFYDTLTKKLDECEKTGKKFFYVLDSMDALTSEADIKKNSENMVLRDNGKDGGGSFGMSKASVNSKRLGQVRNRLKKLGCTLFIVSQERDDSGFGKMPGAKTYSGGHALKFYADAQLWFKHAGVIEATVAGKKRCIGNKGLIDLTKNRLTGQKHKKIPIEISWEYGLDNVGTLIDYLLDEKVWVGKTKINVNGSFGLTEDYPKLKLCSYIEMNDLEDELYKIVDDTFKDIQSKIKEKFKRKKRYK